MLAVTGTDGADGVAEFVVGACCGGLAMGECALGATEPEWAVDASEGGTTGADDCGTWGNAGATGAEAGDTGDAAGGAHC